MPHIIRTSDRLTFKSCRQKWDLGSKIRQDYEPITAAKPLEIGTAFHAAEEVYYNPDTWDWDQEVVEGLARAKYAEVCKQQKTQYLRIKSSEDMAIEVEVDFSERLELGKAMLEQYFKYAHKHDNFTPILTEIEFEVPIPVPYNLRDGAFEPYARLGFGMDEDFNLTYRGEPVVYQGRVDLVVVDDNGDYWIFDHKTAGSLASTEWLDLDDQIGSYCWALKRMLNLPIKGFIYNEIVKKILHPPPRNQKQYKGRWLSVNKQMDTTYEMYLEAIKETGEPVELYEEMLQYLRDNPKEVVRRTRQWRTDTALAILERRLFLEAVDMLNDPSIYPNPSKMACNGCWFKPPCQAIQEGGDVQFILDYMYEKRTKETV